MTKAIETYYDNNQELIDYLFHEYISENDWGSGEDAIDISDGVFWDFVEYLYNQENL